MVDVTFIVCVAFIVCNTPQAGSEVLRRPGSDVRKIRLFGVPQNRRLWRRDGIETTSYRGPSGPPLNRVRSSGSHRAGHEIGDVRLSLCTFHIRQVKRLALACVLDQSGHFKARQILCPRGGITGGGEIQHAGLVVVTRQTAGGFLGQLRVDDVLEIFILWIGRELTGLIRQRAKIAGAIVAGPIQLGPIFPAGVQRQLARSARRRHPSTPDCPPGWIASATATGPACHHRPV